jgi:hypothetical protein
MSPQFERIQDGHLSEQVLSISALRS